MDTDNSTETDKEEISPIGSSFDEFYNDFLKHQPQLDDPNFDDLDYMYSNYIYEDMSTIMLDHMQTPNSLAYESGKEYDRQKTRRTQYKQFKQEHGFDPSEIWSLDINIAKFVYPRLVKFKQDLICVPVDLSEEEWRNILDKIIFAMRVLAIGTDEEFNQFYNKVNEGCELFGKYMLQLNS